MYSTWNGIVKTVNGQPSDASGHGDPYGRLAPEMRHRLKANKAVDDANGAIYDLNEMLTEIDKEMATANNEGKRTQVMMYWKKRKEVCNQIAKMEATKMNAKSSVMDVRMQKMAATEVEIQMSQNDAMRDIQGRVDIQAFQESAAEQQELLMSQVETQKQMAAINSTADKQKERMMASSIPVSSPEEGYPEDLASFLVESQFNKQMSTIGSLQNKPEWQRTLQRQIDEEAEQARKRKTTKRQVDEKT